MSTITLITCDNIQGINGKEFVYNASINGAALLSSALENLGIQTQANVTYKALVYRKGTSLVWVEPKKSLSHYHLRERTTLYVLKTNVPLSINHSSGVRKKLLVDITKPVSELVKFLAEKMRIGHGVGYSLFTVDPDETEHPLDLELTIPQQRTNFETLLFKRRYFCILKSHVSDRAEAFYVFNDVKSHLNSPHMIIYHDQALELAFFSLYAQANSPEEVTSSSIPVDISTLFPTCVKPLPEDRQKLIDRVKAMEKPLSRNDAVYEYLIIAHQIPFFGCEVFKTKYHHSEEDRNSRVTATIIIGPKSIELILPSGESSLNIPWFRFVSCKEHKSSVDIKYVERKGTESGVSIKVKSPNELKTIIIGYSSIIRSLGAELLVEGFLQEDRLKSKIDAGKLSKFYIPDDSMSYTYYPGNVEDLMKFMECTPELEFKEPEIYSLFQQMIRLIIEQPSLISNRLVVIKSLDKLLLKDDLSDYSDPTLVEKAMISLSTANILPSTVSIVLDEIQLIIENQKLIRTETMTKLESSRKYQLTKWLKTLKDHKQKLIDLNKSLLKCPSHGRTVLLSQRELIQLFSDIKELVVFIESISFLSPDSSYIPSLEHFKNSVKNCLSPLLPHHSLDQIKHLSSLYDSFSCVGVVQSLFFDSLSDSSVNDNPDVVNDIQTKISELGEIYLKAHKTRFLIDTRPFLLKYISQMKDEMSELKRSMLQMRSQSQLIFDITGDDIINDVILYAKVSIEDSIDLLSGIPVEPFRDIPLPKDIKFIHDQLVDLFARIMVLALSPEAKKNSDVVEKIQQQGQSMKIVMTELKKQINSPTRSIFAPVHVAHLAIQDIMLSIQKISSMLSDATIIHQFSNLYKTTSMVLSAKNVTIDVFNNALSGLDRLLKSINQESTTLSKIISFSISLKESSCIDEQERFLIEMMDIIKTSLLNEMEEKNIGQALLDEVSQLLDCIRQLPEPDLVQPPSLLILPFFHGKDISKMNYELLVHMRDLSKFYEDILRFNTFSSNESVITLLKHWSSYFDSMASQIEGLHNHESILLSRLKEVVRKQPHIRLFSQFVKPYFNEHKFIGIIDIFFKNIEIIITKLSQPHVSSISSTKFSEKVVPLFSQAETSLSKYTNVPDKQVSDKVKALRQVFSQRLADANSSDPMKQQDLADKVYSQLSDLLPIIRENPDLTSLGSYLIMIQNNLSEFTALSLQNPFSHSSSKMLTPMVAEETIEKLCTNVTSKSIMASEVFDTFRNVSKEIELLPPIASYATKALQIADHSKYTEDIVRVLIYLSETPEKNVEQLQKLSIHYSVEAAGMISNLKDCITNLPIELIESQKAKYYHSIICQALNNLDPRVLIQYPSFPSVSLTYNSLRDLRALLPLYLSENPNPNIQKLSSDYMYQLEQADMSLSMCFYSHVNEIISKIHDLSILDDGFNQYGKELEKLKTKMSSSVSLISLDSVALGEIASTYSEIEEKITSLLNSNDLTAGKALSNIHHLKEMKFIIQQWMKPMPEFIPEEFRISILSTLQIASLSTKDLTDVLRTNVMKIPLVFSKFHTYLSSAVHLAKSHFSSIPQFQSKMDSLNTQINSVIDCCSKLFCQDTAYKADIELQKIIPQLVSNVDGILHEFSSYEEPDYSIIPKAIRLASPRQIEIVTSTMENTEFYEPTKEICSLVKHVLDTPIDSSSEVIENSNQEAARSLTSLIELLPTYTLMPEEEGKNCLVSSLSSLLSNSCIEKTHVYESVPKVVASYVRLLPTIKPESIESLGVSPIGLIESFQQFTAVNDNSEFQHQCLYEKLNRLNHFISYCEESQECLKSQTTSAAVQMIQALDSSDPELIKNEFSKIVSLRAAAENKGVSSATLPSIINSYQELSEEINLAVVQHSQLKPESRATIDKIMRIMIKEITGETMQLTDTIHKAQTISSLLDIRTNNNLNARTLIGNQDLSNKDSNKHLLFVSSNMSLLSFRGLSVLEKPIPRSFYREYISLFNSSLRTYSCILQSNSIDVKKSLRMFRRIVDNLGDIIDDLSFDIIYEPLSGFEEQIKNFLVKCVQIESVMSSLGAAFSVAEIPQSFTLVLSEQVPIMQGYLSEFKQISSVLIDNNTKEDVSVEFSKYLSLIEEFVCKICSLDSHSDLQSFVGIQAQLANFIEESAFCVMEMTNVAQYKYDPESSSRLPIKYSIPPIPLLSLDCTVKKMSDEFLESKDILEKYMENTKLFVHQAPIENSEIINSSLRMINQTTDFLTRLLGVSISSLSIDNQVSITSCANKIVSLVNAFIKCLKSKCLANPTWDNDARKVIQEYEIEIEQSSRHVLEAVDIAEKEAMKRDETAEMIYSSVKPLQSIIPRIEEALNIIDPSVPPTVVGLYSNIGQLSTTVIATVSTILLHIKDNPKDTTSLVSMCDAALHMAQSFNHIPASFSTMEVLMQVSLTISNELTQFRSFLSENSSDGLRMINTIDQLDQGAKTLQETINQAIKRANQSKPEKAVKKQPMVPKDQLLTRLKLEAKVHCSRWLLEAAQKQLELME